jgi:hypothetical protein
MITFNFNEIKKVNGGIYESYQENPGWITF